MTGKLINRDNFFAIKQSQYIVQVMSPLIPFGISYFNHIRIFRDLSRFSLGNKADWLMHFFVNKYYNKGRFSNISKNFNLPNKLYSIWLGAPSDGVIEVARNDFNIDNGITIINNCVEYIDIFLFASTRDNYSINNFYINNVDLLGHFICYYKEKARAIINSCSPDLYIIENSHDPAILVENNTGYNLLDNKIREDFYKKSKVNRYYFHIRDKEIYLTKMEYFAIKYLLEGNSLKKTANLLQIKYRTLISYLTNAKQRSNIYSTHSLLEDFKALIITQIQT